jgi:hypothetical protein
VPTRAAAPAQAPTEGISAPVPAGAAPAIKVPAVAAATENILADVDRAVAKSRARYNLQGASGPGYWVR